MPERTTSAASVAPSVPAPIVTPSSVLAKTGASLIPSVRLERGSRGRRFGSDRIGNRQNAAG